VGIGRAKSVPADEYKENYETLSREMEEQIRTLAEKGGDEL